MSDTKIHRVYKLSNSVDDEFYIGSTSQRYLSTRLALHKYHAVTRVKKSKLYKHMCKTGTCNWFIEEICKVEDPNYARIVEEEQRVLLNPGLNMRRCYNDEPPKYNKPYYEKNKDRILDKFRAKYWANRETILAKAKAKRDAEKLAASV